MRLIARLCRRGLLAFEFFEITNFSAQEKGCCEQQKQHHQILLNMQRVGQSFANVSFIGYRVLHRSYSTGSKVLFISFSLGIRC